MYRKSMRSALAEARAYTEANMKRILQALQDKLSKEGGAAGFDDLRKTAKSMGLNLTPQTNSKVLISFCGSKGATTTNPVRFRPVRTKSGTATALGMQGTADWQGNYATMGNYIGGDNSNQILHVAFQWIDASPGGDGSTTINYKLQWAINSGTAYLGQSSPVSIIQRAGGIQFYVIEIGA